ncbi:MAG: acyl-CoA dehydrogenase [Leptospirales bacterium]|nr:acyl-CoA dehydrogenase [Leptospirales bacterium]HNJ35028.1 acyl-CoA dehydrogenase [Leptospiraceae bacterium]
MTILHPTKFDFSPLDPASSEIMQKTVQFFENKGLAKVKHDDHERVWYADFLEFIKQEKIFYRLMTPAQYGDSPDVRFDSYRNNYFNEILGFYGLAYWYTWQVTMLGLGPIWNGSNEEIKKETAKRLKEGAIFAFGLSERAHGADLISSEMTLKTIAPGKYIANGRKYYIGNANKASFVSTFAKDAETGDYVFFAAESAHPNYTCVQNVVNSQNYVAEYELKDYPITDKEILSRGRDAWDASLATIAYCKYNLGWASIGICTHAFYEAINHAANRVLFKHKVTDFPHIKQFMTDAWTRLLAMRLFSFRASDYMRAASEDDKRYLLYNPMVKMKVTIQGEEVVNLLWDVIAAKGFEKDGYFEMAARDIRGLPKLEGTAQVNMVLIMKFMDKFFFEPSPYPDLPRQKSPGNDSFMFAQGSTSKGQNRIQFHDFNIAYNQSKLPNVKIFQSQIEVFKKFLKEAAPDKAQTRDLDFMLNVGELFTLVPYGQLILECAKSEGISDDLVDQIFDFMVRDFSRYALQMYSRTSSTQAQMDLCMQMIKKPAVNTERFERVWKENVLSLNMAYVMKP